MKTFALIMGICFGILIMAALAKTEHETCADSSGTWDTELNTCIPKGQ